MILELGGLHICNIQGNPIEVKSLDVIGCVFQERVPRGGSHKRVVNADGKSRRGDPTVRILSGRAIWEQKHTLFVTKISLEEV